MVLANLRFIRQSHWVLYWDFIKFKLFGVYSPESSTWTDINKIVEILNIIGTSPAYNHMLFSNKGGLDFSNAKLANETGMLEINADGCCQIVKPKALHFSGFEDCRWNYFLLELEEIDPILSAPYFGYEILVEDTPSHYVSAQHAQYGVYDYDTGVPLPAESRIVRRYTNGKFLIVLKSGPYNSINSTYDGRHGEYDAVEFRKYIEDLSIKFGSMKEQVSEKYKDISDWEIEHRILKSSVFDNPRNKCKSPIKGAPISSVSEEQFLHNNYKSISFLDLLKQQDSELANVKFYFEYHMEYDIFSWLLNNKVICVCQDGTLKEIDINDEQCFYVYSREEALEFKKACEKRISDFLSENGISPSGLCGEYISIDLLKVNIPTHLFTKDDIRNLMRNADDRTDNQLVVDEYGVPHILTRRNEGMLYPVRAETWDAGNNYVGKYSNLATLDETYIGMLHAWLLYLKTGRRQTANCFEPYDEESLTKEIQSLITQ